MSAYQTEPSSEPHLSQQIFVVLALWVIEFTMFFVTKSTGVLLPVLLDQFDSNMSDVGVVVSLVVFSGSVIGLSAQAFTRVFHVRPVLIACGIITSIGLLVNALANDIVVLIIGMTLAGAMTMGNSVAMGTIVSYFPKNSDVVSNIVTSALPIAFMITAPITQLLLDIYDWRSALMIINALFCHNIAAAIYMKPWKNNSRDNYSSLPFETIQEKECEDIQSDSRFDILKDVLNISLLKNVSIQVVLVTSFVNGMVLNGCAVYLVSVAQSKNLSPNDAASVVTFSGVGAFLVRLILAVLAVRGTFSNYRLLLLISSVILMISFCGFSWASSFWAFSVFSFLLGFGFGIVGSQTVIAINHSVGEQDTVGAMSWAQIFSSGGYLMGGYVSGLLYDLSGSFFMTLITLCAVSFLIPVALLAEYLWTKCNR